MRSVKKTKTFIYISCKRSLYFVIVCVFQNRNLPEAGAWKDSGAWILRTIAWSYSAILYIKKTCLKRCSYFLLKFMQSSVQVLSLSIQDNSIFSTTDPSNIKLFSQQICSSTNELPAVVLCSGVFRGAGDEGIDITLRLGGIIPKTELTQPWYKVKG